MKTKRIEVFDGLRVIAILLVMIYHFYSRFEGQYYTYPFKSPEIFKLGNWGVELFFIISGFVITMTLTRCNTFLQFIKKRFIRLIPGMIICSSITFLIFNLVGSSGRFADSKSLPDWILSNTFLSPEIPDKILHTHLRYTDGSYWSLWIEIEFYVIGGSLYFLSPKNFLRNYSILSLIMVFGFIITNNFGYLLGHYVSHIFNLLLAVISLAEYNLWFLAGIIINQMYFKGNSKKLLIYLLGVFILQALITQTLYSIEFTTIAALIFITILYKPAYLQFLSNKTFSLIGVSSYSLYLIHQNLGVYAIYKLSPYFGSFNSLIPIIIGAVFITFSIVSYKFLELPIGNKLKRVFLDKQTTREESEIVTGP